MTEKLNDRWEVAVAATDGHFQQVSFVNSICTTKGGSHVRYIGDQLSEAILGQISVSFLEKVTPVLSRLLMHHYDWIEKGECQALPH